MIDTIMFDLDGTLARFVQDEFLHAYFNELGKVFVKFGYDKDAAVKGVWGGTKAMIQNDGSMLNTQRFWETFAKIMGIEGEKLKTIEAACDSFYTNEFNVVKSVIRHSDVPKRIVREMAARGFCVVLATNPLFPPCAVDTRLSWIGLTRHDFVYFTNYENSSFCKPNPGYYNDIFSKTEKSPQQCLMVGNNPAEDMCVSELGADVFLVTDFMENEAGLDINKFKHGTIEDLETYLLALPIPS
ncbi:MAG: HAD family hydrolase [Oscillospiraceae bacterium]|jgi:FMN phosphatase YigB (HAD superfamily)|nr:HAD family hydrolase [Oscillospiraceae bacterium]